MKETVLFFEDYLVEDTNGYLEVIPSYSPEHGDTARNTTMDVAGIRMTLRNLISACRELGAEKGNIARWQAILAKLPPYRVNAQGRLAEWIDETMPDDLEHRHASHFLPMWHGLQPEIARDSGILAAARKAVADKAAVRCRDKKGGVMGFGTVQIGLAAASLRDAETVWRVIDNLATLYYFPTFTSCLSLFEDGSSGTFRRVRFRLPDFDRFLHEPILRLQAKPDQHQHHRHLDQHTYDSCQRGPGRQPEEHRRCGNGHLKMV
jgi:hypothetical protein